LASNAGQCVRGIADERAIDVDAGFDIDRHPVHFVSGASLRILARLPAVPLAGATPWPTSSPFWPPWGARWRTPETGASQPGRRFQGASGDAQSWRWHRPPGREWKRFHAGFLNSSASKIKCQWNILRAPPLHEILTTTRNRSSKNGMPNRLALATWHAHAAARGPCRRRDAVPALARVLRVCWCTWCDLQWRRISQPADMHRARECQSANGFH
jgi:hypothetical protein